MIGRFIGYFVFVAALVGVALALLAFVGLFRFLFAT